MGRVDDEPSELQMEFGSEMPNNEPERSLVFGAGDTVGWSITDVAVVAIERASKFKRLGSKLFRDEPLYDGE